MNRWPHIVIVLACCALSACAEQAPESLPSPGGSWTAKPTVRPTMIRPARTLNSAEKLDFWSGFAFFRDPWITPPVTTTDRDGLGPYFNAQSCVACHRGGGRGDSLFNTPETLATVVRLPRDSLYGEQLQPMATFADGGATAVSVTAYHAGEGRLLAASERRDVTLPDDSTIELNQPRFQIDANHAGHSLDAFSVRIAPALLGMGLLESISLAQIEALEDPDDRDGDGISGRIHWVQDPVGDRRAGRYGWKAEQASVRSQTAAAFAQDIGISNPVYRYQNCAAGQTACFEQLDGNDEVEGVEIVTPLFDRVVYFTAHIAPPTAGAMTPRVQRGWKTFRKVGCDGCHTPSFNVDVTTRDGETMSEQIWPYTDLLLHDMGDELADTLGSGDASASEWRTPPLWGLGRALKINPKTGLLHDGRARTITEAIAWHGGEADSSRQHFFALSATDREALVAYVLAL
ncbi:MAG: di-heme oxidoredictase family protein [Pseudomonadota bacterium]